MSVPKTDVTNEAKDGAINDEKDETEDEGVERYRANRKEVAGAEEVNGDDGHHTDERGDKEAEKLFGASLAREDTFRIETKSG